MKTNKKEVTITEPSPFKIVPVTEDFDGDKVIGKLKIKRGKFNKPNLVFSPAFKVIEKVGDVVKEVELVGISLISDEVYEKWDDSV